MLPYLSEGLGLTLVSFITAQLLQESVLESTKEQSYAQTVQSRKQIKLYPTSSEKSRERNILNRGKPLLSFIINVTLSLFHPCQIMLSSLPPHQRTRAIPYLTSPYFFDSTKATGQDKIPIVVVNQFWQNCLLEEEMFPKPMEDIMWMQVSAHPRRSIVPSVFLVS